MAPYQIRVFGDPVLRQPTVEVTNIDGTLAKLAQDMLTTMYEAPGIGLAATQVGVQKRLCVYDIGEGPHVLVNGRITEARGEWTFEEGCLSVPGLAWYIVRPEEVDVEGLDLDGNGVSIEADELLARLFLHELDHLDGMLVIDRLDTDQRKEAMRVLRHRAMGTPAAGAPGAERAATR
jgi:peptide deformylase